MNKRLEFIDIAKGIGIFLMVLGHSYSENNGSLIIKWLYSFHMPLFFIASGVLYGIRFNNIGEIHLNLKKKLLTLLLPYFIWNTTYQLFLTVLSVLGGAPLFTTLKDHLIMVLQLSGSAMWFLPSMFFAFVFFRFLIQKKIIHIIYCIFLMCIGILSPDMQNMYLGWILRAFIGTGFMGIGFYFYNIYNKELSNSLLIFVFIVHTCLTFLNGTVSIAARFFSNPILYVMNSCLGTLLIFNISMKLSSSSLSIKNIFDLWGKNSIKILCFHTFIIQIIRLLDYKIFNNMLPQLFYFEGIIFSIIIMLILTLFMPLINKLFNWSFGILRN